MVVTNDFLMRLLDVIYPRIRYLGIYISATRCRRYVKGSSILLTCAGSMRLEHRSHVQAYPPTPPARTAAIIVEEKPAYIPEAFMIGLHDRKPFHDDSKRYCSPRVLRLKDHLLMTKLSISRILMSSNFKQGPNFEI